MNINIVRHFLHVNKQLIVNKSLANCHVEGVNSILFDDTPENRIRLFIARKNHTLWKNTPSSRELSVALHTHHCNLTLEIVLGYTTNWTTEHGYLVTRPLQPYKYESNILTGKSSFVPKDEPTIFTLNGYPSDENPILELPAQRLHTVNVGKDEEAAWFVYEGKEDPSYSPTCYSNADLTKFDDSNLYKKMTYEQIIENLTLIYPNL